MIIILIIVTQELIMVQDKMVWADTAQIVHIPEKQDQIFMPENLGRHGLVQIDLQQIDLEEEVRVGQEALAGVEDLEEVNKLD